MQFQANTTLSVNGKTFTTGTVITEKLAKVDERFLLRDGYISVVDAKISNVAETETEKPVEVTKASGENTEEKTEGDAEEKTEKKDTKGTRTGKKK